MKKVMVLLLALCLVPVGIAAGVALADPPEGGPPGQLPCDHGNAQKPCRPDPQPDRGKDCLPHGRLGGENEDHCGPTETEPPTTTGEEPPGTVTTPTTTTPTTPTPTTPTETTSTTPTPSSSTPSPPVVPATPPPANSTQPTTPAPTSPPDSTVRGPEAGTPASPPASTPGKPSEANPPAPVGAPVRPAPGKPCPPGTRRFKDACHATVEGSG